MTDQYTFQSHCKILLDEERVDDCDKELHQTKKWADTFWRRKNRHNSREDPEINIITEYVES